MPQGRTLYAADRRLIGGNVEAVIRALCVSEKRGTAKVNAGEAEFVENYGIRGDAHAGDWHRQVSLLSYESVKAFRARGCHAADGAFGENILAEGIDFKKLAVGTILQSKDVRLEVTQIGKHCHAGCEIAQQTGDCIMPREGIFARVLHGGTLKTGDVIYVREV